MSDSRSSDSELRSSLVAPSDDRGYLLTEQVNPASHQLDQLSTDALVTSWALLLLSVGNGEG